METMIEKCARAITASQKSMTMGDIVTEALAQSPAGTTAASMKTVRLVLTALLEPSEAMVTKGLDEWDSATGAGIYETNATDIRLIIRAALQAALDETPA